MKSKKPATHKRVKRYNRKISKANLAIMKRVPKNLTYDINPDELLRESLTSEEFREILDNEENIFPDSTFNFV